MRRLPRLPTRRSRAQDRLNRMNPETRSRLSKRVRKGRAKRVARSMGRRFLEGYGLGGYLDQRAEEQRNTKGLGIFGEAAKKKINKGIDLPVLDSPEKVTKENTPSVSSIVKQLEALLKAADKIGALNSKQQKALVDQITQAKRIAKEQEMESNVPSAIPETNVGVDGGSISPLTEIFEKLSKEVEKLLDVVEEKNQEQQEGEGEPIGARGRFLDALGLEDYRKQRRKEYLRANQYAGWTGNNKLSDLSSADKQALTSRGYTITENGRVRGPNNRFASKSQIEGTLRDVQRSQLRRPGVLGRATDRAAGAVRSGIGTAASRTGGAIKSGATNLLALIGRPAAAASAAPAGRSAMTSARTAATTFGTTLKRGAAAGVKAVNLNNIKRAARPIITKALGKTAIKSIPILGTVAGLGFAVGRLLDGDPVGAGLEAASGLAGPVTAIPALVALTSRDIYTSTFGIPPEQDPEVGARMGMVTSAVKAVAEDVLGDTVEPKSPPTSAVAKEKSGLQTLQKAQEKVKAESISGGQQATQSPPPTSSPTGAGGGGAPTTGGSTEPPAAPPAPSISPPASEGPKTESSGTPATMPVPDENPYPNAEDALKQKVEPTVGAAIAEASQLNENLAAGAPSVLFPSGQQAPMPATSPTTRNGAIGMGNVPDPTYGGAGDILAQLYFGAAA